MVCELYINFCTLCVTVVSPYLRPHFKATSTICTFWCRDFTTFTVSVTSQMETPPIAELQKLDNMVLEKAGVLVLSGCCERDCLSGRAVSAVSWVHLSSGRMCSGWELLLQAPTWSGHPRSCSAMSSRRMYACCFMFGLQN